ncbi:MAG: PKD domain-containing protein [Bacteroidetes bacterium]|nr:PKD domain-containing protein [Bacteroidota bacterium]
MKSTLRIVLFFAFFGFLFTLQAQTADVTKGCIPLEVQFTAPDGATDFYWEFMDGVTSILENPINTFNTAGEFQVEFFDGVNGTLIGSVTISVYEKPELAIDATPASGCAPLEVSFEDITEFPSGISVLGYNWVFEDGGSAVGTDVPTHTFTDAGSYYVSLEVMTNFESCNVTQIFDDIIIASTPPDVQFTTTPTPPIACQAPFTVTFSNQSSGDGALTYEWDFANGNTSNEVNPPAQTFSEEGFYAVTLTATDTTGCSATKSVEVSVGEPQADFEISDTVCVGNPIQIQNQSVTGFYTWTFDAGTFPATSTQTNPTVRFDTEGMHTITLTVTSLNGVCSGEITKEVYTDKVNAEFTSDPSYSCFEPVEIVYTALSGNAAEYLWTFSDGTSASGSDTVHTWVNMDTTTHSINGQIIDSTSLLVTNPSGCTATFMDHDTIHLPNALFKPDTVNGCAPVTVEFTDLSTSNEEIASWTWIYGDGNEATFDNNDPHSYVFTDPGEYDVVLVLENSAGCTDTSYTITIEVGSELSPDFSVDETEICPGESVQFTDLSGFDGIDAWHYSSDSHRLSHCFQEPNPTWTFGSETGSMDVTLDVEYNGCISTVTKENLISVKGPVAKIDYLIECESPFDVQLTNQSMETTNVTWELGDNNSSVISDFTHTYIDTGAYKVILTAENPSSGCPASQDSVTVFIQDIEASFELDPTYCIGNPVMLDATASLGVNDTCWKGYTWYFIDKRPITSQDSIIEYVFQQRGDHEVHLAVEDINGCKDTITQTTRVYQVFGNFTATDDLICLPSQVDFTDFSTGDTTIVEWMWEFGDGNTSEEQNPSNIFSTPPTGGNSYQVTMTAKDVLECTGQFNFEIELYQPVSFISSDPANRDICVGTEIDFFATDYTEQGSNLSFNWNFGTGQTSDLQNPSATFNEEGTYFVQLNFEEIATGCQGQETVVVSVQDYPQAAFTSSVDDEPIICAPQNILFQDASVSNYPLTQSWDFGNGQTGLGATVAAAFDKGNYTVQLVVSTPYGCADTVSRNFELVGPKGDFVMDKNVVCKNEAITFQLADASDVSSFSWVFGDGEIAENVNPVTHAYTFHPPSGRTVAKLILTGEDGACTFTVEKEVFIHQVIADFLRNDGVDTSICVTLPMDFTNTSQNADIFNWSFGDNTFSTQENPAHSYQATGTYIVELAIQNSTLGCLDTIQKEVLVGELPDLEAFGDIVCLGDTAFIGVTSPMAGWTYSWTPANALLSPTASQTGAVASENTLFEVLVTDPSGCHGTVEAEVVVTPPIQAMNFDTLVAEGTTVTLPIEYSDIYNFTWNPATGLSCQECSDPTVTPNESTTYQLFVTDNQGCFENTFNFNIQVYPEDIDIPNIFTPDNDGTNDYFSVLVAGESIQIFNSIELRVFNRWGQVVYDNENPNQGWDGNFNGKPSPSAVYVYILDVEFVSGKKTQYSGDVTLLR